MVFARTSWSRPEIVGETPWIGEAFGRKTFVVSPSEDPAQRIGYLFVDGHLQGKLLGERQTKVEPYEGPRLAVPSLCDWPTITDEMVESADEKYGQNWKDNRLKLWYRNPNAAGLLLAELALVALAFSLLVTRKGRFLLLAFFAAATVGVVLSASRSAFVAFALGLAILLLPRVKSLLTCRRLLGIGLVVIVFALVLALSGQLERLTVGLVREGYEETSRLPIWREVPQMILSSPNGCGWRHSGDAYMNWFQPLERMHAIRGLISTHLTWLVEFGWLSRGLYVIGWAGLLILLVAEAFRRRALLPLAVWSAFFVASVFNTIGIEWTLWVIPLAVLAGGLIHRGVPRQEWAWALGGGVGVLALGLTGLWIYSARAPSRLQVRCTASSAVVNGTSATNWVVDDGYVLDGGNLGLLGKSVRVWYSRHDAAPALGITQMLDQVPAEAMRVMIVGRTCAAFVESAATFFQNHPALRELVFLSPSVSPKECLALSRPGVNMRVVSGEFARRRHAVEPEVAGEKIISGCGLFIPEWIGYIAR